MAGPVIAGGGLPPLLPTPTRCVFRSPPPASYAAKIAGRASLSQNWIDDKFRGGGRASRSSSWVEDKLLGRAGTSTSGIERTSRPAWKDGRNGAKRAASRAPSADRFDKKARPPTEPEKEQHLAVAELCWGKPRPWPAQHLANCMECHLWHLGKEAKTTEEGDALEFATERFAGSSFFVPPHPSKLPIPIWVRSPEPSELPVPSFLKAQQNLS